MEKLREALLNLEEARKLQAQQREMAEALLAGLRVLVMTPNSNELFPRLFEVLKKPLDFHTAFVLIVEDDGSLTPVATSDPLYEGTIWKSFKMFHRVIEGDPVAVFDTQAVEEWRIQSDEIRRAASSALHFSIHTAERRAIFVCTHTEKAHFSRYHIKLARRFSILATQGLQKIESEARMANLEEKLESESRLAELNKKLAESEKKLERSKKIEALGLLAGGVAHDLNNIISGIVN